MAITNANFIIILPSTLVSPIHLLVHLKFSSISCFPRECHMAIGIHCMPKSKDVHCYWPVAKQRMPLFLARCHCSRIRSIQLWNSGSYCADFSISEGIPEGRATGCFWTPTTRSNFSVTFATQNQELSLHPEYHMYRYLELWVRN
jgi:hypothetical protein